VQYIGPLDLSIPQRHAELTASRSSQEAPWSKRLSPVVSRILSKSSWISDGRTRDSLRVPDPVNMVDAVRAGLACSRSLPEHFLIYVSENCQHESQRTFCFFSREAKLEEFESYSRYDQRSMPIRMNYLKEDSQLYEFSKPLKRW
jgi:hypothetical protein